MHPSSYSSFPRRLLRLLRSAAIAYLLVILGMTFLERWLVYPAPPANEGDWSPQHLDFEEANFVSGDGTKLHGWFFENPNAKTGTSRRAVLYLHGNGEHVAYAAELMPLIVDKLDASVLVFDYRGYGRSEGAAYEEGLIADGLAASKWLAERTGTPPEQQVLIGRSIGSGVAVAMAERQGAGCLVLQNTFARLTDTAARQFPWLPVRWLMKNRYPSIDRIQKYDGPVFSCHGTDDSLVPIDQGKSLFNAAPTDRKEFYTLDGLGHNDWLPEEYWDALARFLGEFGE